MKKIRFLFIIPALFSLASCGLGKEISADQAKEIAKNMQDVEEPKNYEYNISISTYDAEEKVTVKGSYLIKANEAGNFYASVKIDDPREDGYSSKEEVYQVKNDEYEEVVYLKSYDYDEKKDVIEVVTKKDNPNYDYISMSAQANASSAVSVYALSSEDLYTMIESAESQSKASDLVSYKYFSTGNNNLTIQETMKKSEDAESMSGSGTMTFDKGLISKLESKIETKDGSKVEIKGTFKYPNSLKIDLPRDWKSYLDK